MVTSNQHIEITAISSIAETSGHRSVYLNRPPNFIFESGDWIDLHFKHGELDGGKTYSISSSPTETEIRITFREGMSDFKKALQAISGNEHLYISRYGNDYGFRLKNSQSSTLIAGGVGIAPFRSMLKEMYDNHDKNEVTLIYLNQGSNFLFSDELNEWNSLLPNMNVHYLDTKELNRKKREKLTMSLIKNVNQNFYLSGPPGMVEHTEHLLIDNGAQVRDIRVDIFSGY